MSNPKKARRTIRKACKAFKSAKQNDKVGATFEVEEGKKVDIPQSIIDLVLALNPSDSKKREAITTELFKKEK